MILALLLALQSASPAPSPAPSPQRPNLAGHWAYDAEKSDDVQAKLQAAQQARQASAPAPSSTRRRRGYGPAGSPPPAPDWVGLAQAPRVLTITQTETEVTVLDSDGRLLQLHPGAPTQGDEPRSFWRDETFVLETRDSGVKTTQVFAMANGTLIVNATLVGPTLGPITLKRIYQPATP